MRAEYDHIDDPEDEADPELPSGAQWRAFNADIDAWIAGVHTRHPVAFLLKPIDVEYSTETDTWHDWSVARVPESVLPYAGALGRPFASALGEALAMWREWLGAQRLDEQKRILAALSDEQRAELRRRRALPRPEGRPVFDPPPAKEDVLRLLLRLAAEGGGRIEERLEEAVTAGRNLEKEYWLPWLYHSYGAPGDLERRREITNAALQHGAEYPEHWYQRLADIELEREDLDASQAALRISIWYLKTYDAGPLITAMLYHQRRGEPEKAAIAYHAGRRWVSSFASDVRRVGGEAIGACPPNLAERFGELLMEWLAPRWHVQTMRIDELAHWLSWFDRIKSKALRPWRVQAAHECDRRIALHKAMSEAASPAEGEALLDEVLALPHDSKALLLDAYALVKTAPGVALALYRRVATSPDTLDEQARRQSWCNLLYCCMETRELDLAEELMPGAFQIAPGNPPIFFNAACIAALRGERAAALLRIALALRHGYAPDMIRAEELFASYHGQPDFEALFAPGSEVPG